MRKRTKFLTLRISIILLFAILAGRLWYVQIVMSSYYTAQADTSKVRIEPVLARRGIIYDRLGRQLVYNTPSWQVLIVPGAIPHARAQQIYRLLSHLLGGNPSPAGIAAVVQKYFWRPYAPAPVKTRVDPETAMVIKQLHGRLPGVRVEPVAIRHYVEGAQFALSHILGYTGRVTEAEYNAAAQAFPAEHVGVNDDVGQAGLELKLDPYLHGINGRQRVEVDAGERPIRVLTPGRAQAGDDVYLTIDWKLQQQVANDLQAAMRQENWSKGVVILEDVHSGQILAMVSLPSYNNNWFSGGISQQRYRALLNDPAHPLDDQAYSGTFPPGSTFKVITAAAALQTGVADVNRFIDDTGAIDLGGGAVFQGWTPPPGLGPVNIVTALQKSSDIYFYTVAGGNPTIGPMPSIGPDRLAYWARQFGLGSPTGIELPNESGGSIPDRAYHLKRYGQPWHIGDSYNTAIGQGDVLTTPLQMVSVAATIANGGIYYRPRIVQRIAGRVLPGHGTLKHSRIIQPFVPDIIRRNFVDPANLGLIQQGMHLSVTPFTAGGTSQFVVDPRIDAAGKTGTAEAPGGPHAWWIGYAPYEHPQVAVVVLVPNANAEGAYAAAPIAHKALEDYFHLPPTKANWLVDVSRQLVGTGH